MTVSAPRAKSYEDLRVWQAARRLATLTYCVTRSFPPSETFGLASQLQRAAVSVSANIAEGWGRGTRPDLRRFVTIARGSLYELECLLGIVEEQGWASRALTAELRSAIDPAGRLLNAFRRSLAKRPS